MQIYFLITILQSANWFYSWFLLMRNFLSHIWVLNIFLVWKFLVSIFDDGEIIMMKLYEQCHPLMRCLLAKAFCELFITRKRSKRQLYLPSSHSSTYLHSNASGVEDEYEETTIWICCYRLKRKINYVIFTFSPSAYLFFSFNKNVTWINLMDIFWLKILWKLKDAKMSSLTNERWTGDAR